MSQSPQAGQFNSYELNDIEDLFLAIRLVSIPSSGSIQFLHGTIIGYPDELLKVSIPSSGSIQFLRKPAEQAQAENQ